MTPLVLALSISHKIEQFGSYAGYASVLGLGVLSMLYFAQAREVRRLREWAGRAPERAAELEAQAVQAAERARAAPARPAAAPVTPAATAATTGATAATTPATAAATAANGPAAPAVPGGTVPTPAGSDTAVATPGAPTPNAPFASPDTAAPATPTPVTAAATPASSSAPTSADDPSLARPSAPASPEPVLPSTSILAGASAPPARPGPGEASTAAGVASSSASSAAAARPRRTIELRSNAARSATVDSGGPRKPHRSSLRLLLPIAGALAVIVVLAVVLLGGGDSGTQTAPNRVVTSTTPTGTTSTPTKAQTIVTVLNGTVVSGLARQLGDRLTAKGYQVNKVGDATDQTQPTSHVAYATGYRAAAQNVAGAVGISTSQIVEMDPDTRVQAGSQARVVVIVGADTAQKAQ